MAARAVGAATSALLLLLLAPLLLSPASALSAASSAGATSDHAGARAAGVAAAGGRGSQGQRLGQPPVAGQSFGGLPAIDDATLADAAAAKAGQAAQRAWIAEAQAKKIVEGNLKFLPLAKAEIATAKSAAKAAEKEDKKATKLLEETRKVARESAMKAAMGFFAQVRGAGAAGSAEEWAARRSMAEKAEVAAARAASNAAMPYRAMLLRGQQVVADYTKRAQALAAAASNLQAEGVTLASSAEQYQMVGQTTKASQIMVTAHSLLNQGIQMRKQAEQLSAEAKEVNDALPLYHQAEEAAFQSAAQTANPPDLPESPPIY